MWDFFSVFLYIADKIDEFDPLDLSSTFLFENFLQCFKNMTRKWDKPLQKIVKRFCEISNSFCFPNILDTEFPCFSKIHFNGPVLNSEASYQYSSVKFPNFIISNQHPNCYCHLKCGSIVVVENIILTKESCKLIICRQFLEKSNFYSSPFLNSCSLDVYLVSNLSALQEKSISDISTKMILLPFRNKQVAFPLLHSSC